MLWSLPTDTFIKPDTFKELVLDKTSEKQISKVVLAKRGHSQTLTSCVTRKHKFVLLLHSFYPVQMKSFEKFHGTFFLLFFFSFFAPSYRW